MPAFFNAGDCDNVLYGDGDGENRLCYCYIDMQALLDTVGMCSRAPHMRLDLPQRPVWEEEGPM